MDNTADDTQVGLNLIRGGFAPEAQHYHVEEVLTEFGTRNVLPHLSKDEFFMDLYTVWTARGSGRSVRYINKRAQELGSSSKYAYHRITGRLRRTKASCGPAIRLFLTEWSEEQGRVIPHPSINTGEKIAAFIDALFRQEDNEKRINNEGLNEQDIQYLLAAQKFLKRPIRLREIINILRTQR